jgi:hypothetical protein
MEISCYLIISTLQDISSNQHCMTFHQVSNAWHFIKSTWHVISRYLLHMISHQVNIALNKVNIALITSYETLHGITLNWFCMTSHHMRVAWHLPNIIRHIIISNLISSRLHDLTSNRYSNMSYLIRSILHDIAWHQQMFKEKSSKFIKSTL